MRYFLKFAYRGTEFHGSQSQPCGGTVQDVMESGMATLLRCPTPLTFAGRTDAGVHAEVMYAHFDYEGEAFDLRSAEERKQLVYRLNRILPKSIAIEDVLPTTDEAHARFDAISRTYKYRITSKKDPFGYELRTQVRPGLDFAAMNRAAACLLGKQDFSSFCKVHTDVKTKICDMMHAEWICENEAEATFVITADRFLRNMVRAVVGTLFEVGYGMISEEQFAEIIRHQDRRKAGESADAQGLYLVDIEYPSTIFTPIIPNNAR